MAKVSYIDDGFLMSEAYLARDYSKVGDYIRKNASAYSSAIDHKGSVYAYDITKNQSLTSIFGFDCYVVKFLFSSIDTLHDEEQEAVLHELCVRLKEEIGKKEGYFNLRMPAHIIDLIRCFNAVFSNEEIYFCGGTVEFIQIGQVSKEYLNHPEIKLFFADEAYINNQRNNIRAIAENGFRLYQGQYHISPVTSVKASEIYTSWIENSMANPSLNKILIAEINGAIAGFCTIRNREVVYEGILSSVDPSFRKHSVYKSLISYLAALAESEDGYFISSTQYDNYIVQGTWGSLGMRPYYSIYNFHLNKR